MKTKTIKKIIVTKLNEWLMSITDETLRKAVKENIVVSGGSIASMLQRIDVNDFDIYIQDIDVLIQLAHYYCGAKVLDGRKKDAYIKDRFPFIFDAKLEQVLIQNGTYDVDYYASEAFVRINNLKPDQVKLDIPSIGEKFEIEPLDAEGKKVYRPTFLSQNAISLSNDIQIVLRFSGTVEEIHKTFDFIHATNYFTFKDGLVLNLAAMTSLITKDLRYQGSLYPLTSIIRMKKFINRGWNIGAGEILKIMFQISELNLKDIQVLEEQLIGVDVAYFGLLIDALRVHVNEELTSSFINDLIDKIFNEYDGEEAKIDN
jgi:hypothetical protein